MPMPSHSPMSASSSRAVGSPSRAASVMKGPVSALASPPRRASRSATTGDPASIMARASRTRALPLAYCSQQPRLPHSQRDAARHDLHVAELAGDAVPPALDVAVDDERAADARAEGDDDDVRLTAGGAEARLGPGRRVGVVVDGDRQRRCAATARRAAARCARTGAARRRRSPGPRRRSPRRRCPRRRCRRGRPGASSSSTALDDGVLDDAGRGRAVRGVTTDAVGDGARLVDDAAGDLRAADVDADGESPGHAGPPPRRRVPPSVSLGSSASVSGSSGRSGAAVSGRCSERSSLALGRGEVAQRRGREADEVGDPARWCRG